MIGLGVISGTTAYRPPLPSCRVGNMFRSILGRFKVGLGWLVNAYSSHSIHMGEWFKPTKPRGLVMGIKGVGYGHKGGLVSMMQGDGFSIEPSGLMEVTMLNFDLAWV